MLFTFSAIPKYADLNNLYLGWLYYKWSFSNWLFSLFSKVFESFVDYVAVEQLDGDNKYDAGEHGLQVTWVFCASVLL